MLNALSTETTQLEVSVTPVTTTDMRKPNSCDGRHSVNCGLSYRECIKSGRESLKENGREMSKLMKRNIEGLFSPNSIERIQLPHWSVRAFNNLNFGDFDD